MSMYPTVGGALINAFNATLFDSYKSAGWQKLASDLSDKYPELDIPAPEHPCFDKDALGRVDWATQAGMTAGLLRNHLRPVDFHLLRMRYTHDGEIIITGITADNLSLRLEMTDNTRSALVDGWPDVRSALVAQGSIRQSVLDNRIRLEYLALRALRPEIVKETFKAEGSEQQATVNQHQYEVRKACRALFKQAKDRAEQVLHNAELIRDPDEV